jgi:septal ring factor EnvC (AmiA/AmiB activator)
MLPPRVLLLAALALAAGGVLAAASPPPQGPAEARRALAEAQAAAAGARARAERLESDAALAGAAAERTAREAAAIAARIQEAEAGVAAAEVEIGLVGQQRAALRASLAQRERPLLELTAALQRLSRRPLATALLRPGSVSDAVHTRALIETMVPEVRRRTAGLRAEIARGQALEAQARKVEGRLRTEQAALAGRRQVLAGLETRQRLAARDVAGNADRESERALALAEQARDLGGLVGALDKAGALGAELAALPGPVLRPPRPEASEVVVSAAAPAPVAPLVPYLLPVNGRLLSGFGDPAAGLASRGIVLVTRPGAIALAPAAGRIAFAAPYHGYGQIVIISHAGGWTSLVTGLARLDVRVGDAVVAGSPLGVTGPGQPVVNLELRQGGKPVNPLEQLRAG